MSFVSILVFVLLVVVASSIKITQEYERAVIFRLGRAVGVRGPGLVLIVPFIEKARRVDLRTITMDIPAQEVITRDNVSVKVSAVLYFRVVDPMPAIIAIEN